MDRMNPWIWRELVLGELGPLTPETPGESTSGCHAAAAGRVSSVGKFLEEDLVAPEAHPRVAVSAMDGFAVRFEDLDPRREVLLDVVADIAAGDDASKGSPVHPGCAARIMTGAVMPEGADSIIEVERTNASTHGSAPSTVRIDSVQGVAYGSHVRRPGEEIDKGSVIAARGSRVTPALIGLAAMVGIESIPARGGQDREPWETTGLRTAILVTGNEVRSVIDDGQEVGDVRDSNGVMLAAALAGLGSPAHLMHTDDSRSSLTACLDEAAASADLIVTTGGIGMGSHDVVRTTLGSAGTGTSRFEKLSLRPGSLQGYGVHRDRAGRLVPMVHLPGTPVAALIGFHLVIPALLTREAAQRYRVTVDATLLNVTPSSATRVMAGRRIAGEPHRVQLLPGRRLAPFATADCMVFLDAEAERHRSRSWMATRIDLVPGLSSP